MLKLMTAHAFPSNASKSPSRGLNIGLWVAQDLLAVGFLMAGAMKLTVPVDQLAQKMPWISGSLGSLVRFIGASEVLGALGLVLPMATKIKPRLTVLAAAALAFVMLLALATHIVRGEPQGFGAPIVLGGLAAFVAWGRNQTLAK